MSLHSTLLRAGRVAAIGAILLTIQPWSSVQAAAPFFDRYETRFGAVGVDGVRYDIGLLVVDGGDATRLFVTVGKQCGKRPCPSVTYRGELSAEQFRVDPVMTPDCQCLAARVKTRFGGKRLDVSWIWDIEPHETGQDGSVVWSAVTANNLMNVACYADGTYTTAADDQPSETETAPARPFPKRLSAAFEATPTSRPGCS